MSKSQRSDKTEIASPRDSERFDRTSALIARFAQFRAKRSSRSHRILLAIALTMFTGGLIVAFLNLPELPASPNWELLFPVALIGAPLTLLCNVAEYQISGSLIGYRIPFVPAVRVSVVAAAANILPLPGSLLVRTQAIRGMGVRTAKALQTTAIVGLGFVATAACLAGVFLIMGSRLPLGAFVGTIGVALLTVTAYATITLAGVRLGSVLIIRLVTIEAASVIVKALRLYLVLKALQLDVELGQAMALAVGGVIGTATGFFPGGLGIAEVLSAGISPLVGLPSALGLLATAVDRVIQLVVLAILTGIMALHQPKTTVDAPPSDPRPTGWDRAGRRSE